MRRPLTVGRATSTDLTLSYTVDNKYTLDNQREVGFYKDYDIRTDTWHYSDGSTKNKECIKFSDLPIDQLFIDRNVEIKRDRNFQYANLIKFPSLKELTIGPHFSNMKILGWGDDLETIICYASTPPAYSNFTNREYLNVVVKVPEESLEAYKQAEGWKNFWNIQVTPSISGVDEVFMESDMKVETARYNLNGQKVGDDYSGIVIVRFSDGSVRKLIQK